MAVSPTAAQGDDKDGPEDGAPGSSRGLSLAGLVRRMGKVGDDRSGCRQTFEATAVAVDPSDTAAAGVLPCCTICYQWWMNSPARLPSGPAAVCCPGLAAWQRCSALAESPAITCLTATSVRAPPRSPSCRSYPRQRHRVFGLRFTAALATRLGPEGMKPYLGPLMVPLFRITEGGSADSEEVRGGLVIVGVLLC